MKLIFLTSMLGGSFQLSPSLDELESYAFSNYDDAESDFDPETASSFDPDNLTGKRVARRAPMVKRLAANFDLTIANGANVALRVELFNFLRSFTKVYRPDFVNGAYLYVPADSFEGRTAGLQGTVGFDNTGALVVHGAADAPLTSLKVSSPTFPYRGLFESSFKRPFRITRVRMTTTTDAQIDNEIVHFKNSFLGGQSQNSISPRTFFRPEQFQGKIIDVPLNVSIDSESGLLYTVNANETVRWNVSIESYSQKA